MSFFCHCVKIINQKAGKVCLGHSFEGFGSWSIDPNAWAYGNIIAVACGGGGVFMPPVSELCPVDLNFSTS